MKTSVTWEIALQIIHLISTREDCSFTNITTNDNQYYVKVKHVWNITFEKILSLLLNILIMFSIMICTSDWNSCYCIMYADISLMLGSPQILHLHLRTIFVKSYLSVYLLQHMHSAYIVYSICSHTAELKAYWFTCY